MASTTMQILEAFVRTLPADEQRALASIRQNIAIHSETDKDELRAVMDFHNSYVAAQQHTAMPGAQIAQRPRTTGFMSSRIPNNMAAGSFQDIRQQLLQLYRRRAIRTNESNSLLRFLEDLPARWDPRTDAADTAQRAVAEEIFEINLRVRQLEQEFLASGGTRTDIANMQEQGKEQARYMMR